MTLRFFLHQLLLSALLGFLISGGVARADDYESGRAAANKGQFATAFSIWKPLADNGDERAQFALGRMYARGDGVARDLQQARRYFELAAARQHPQALLNLGKIYYFGDGTPQDLSRAYFYFSKASAAGITDADSFLAKLKGKVAPGTFVEPTVAPMLPTPADTPAPIGTPAVGDFVFDDHGASPTATATPADPLTPYRSSVAGASNVGADKRSFRFDPVAEAIIRGFPGGMNQLSVYASSLFYGPLVTDDAALSNHLNQANSGVAESQNIMGFAALYAGNPDVARRWFERSAQQGNGTALFALGNFAFDNNYERASQLYQEAAQKGVVAAKRNLGYFLLRGIGADPNKERGRLYLTEASKLGDSLATDLLK